MEYPPKDTALYYLNKKGIKSIISIVEKGTGQGLYRLAYDEIKKVIWLKQAIIRATAFYGLKNREIHEDD